MGGFKNYIEKKLMKEDENTEKHVEPGIVDYKDVTGEIKDLCEYVITEIKQLGVAVKTVEMSGSNLFDEKWFKEEIKEIKDKLSEIDKLAEYSRNL